MELNNDEGWSLEYDGPDLGYLTATVSFLSKSQLLRYDERIQKVIDDSICFISYFAQPDGGFGGIISSRNTVHVYPDGFELNKIKNKISYSLSVHFLKSLHLMNTANPIVMPDRYLGYRIVEYFETAITRRRIEEIESTLLKLPFEKNSFTKIFQQSGIIVKKTKYYYIIINLSKGGAVKIFDVVNNKLILSDSGITVCGERESYTSSWIDPNYNFEIIDDNYYVKGELVKIVSPYQFTSGMIIFRLIQMSFGRIGLFAYYMKILIKKLFISGIKRSKIQFSRNIKISSNKIVIEDRLRSKKHYNIKRILIGGEFHYRYVPQSRYFLEIDKNLYHSYIENNEIKKIYSDDGFFNQRLFEHDSH
tara:strand:- start:448 stop:1536 length:1089 start_codon:yes stop_codon:yes gene_type:complete